MKNRTDRLTMTEVLKCESVENIKCPDEFQIDIKTSGKEVSVSSRDKPSCVSETSGCVESDQTADGGGLMQLRTKGRQTY